MCCENCCKSKNYCYILMFMTGYNLLADILGVYKCRQDAVDHKVRLKDDLVGTSESSALIIIRKELLGGAF